MAGSSTGHADGGLCSGRSPRGTRIAKLGKQSEQFVLPELSGLEILLRKQHYLIGSVTGNSYLQN